MSDITMKHLITERISGARTMDIYIEEIKGSVMPLIGGVPTGPRIVMVNIEFAAGDRPTFLASKPCKTWDDLVDMVAKAKANTL